MYWLTKNYTGNEDQTRLNILFQRKGGGFNMGYKSSVLSLGEEGPRNRRSAGGSVP